MKHEEPIISKLEGVTEITIQVPIKWVHAAEKTVKQKQINKTGEEYLTDKIKNLVCTLGENLTSDKIV